MAALGLLLLAAAGVFGVVVALSNAGADHAAMNLSFFGFAQHMSVGRLFAVGIITGIIGTLGLALMLGKIGRAARKRKEGRAREREVGGIEEVRAERDRLAAELEGERARREVAPAATYPVGTQPIAAPAHADTGIAGQRVPEAAYPAGPASGSTSGSGAPGSGAPGSGGVMDRLRNRG